MAGATSVAFGPLEIAFTDQFSYRWKDRGSGGTHDGGFWHPKPPPGFFALGTLGVPNHNDPSGKNWAICVKAVEGNALAAPTGFELIWTDKGSGSRDDGSCWRPRAPTGYRVMGDVFMAGHTKPPSRDDVRCVRVDLTVDGVLGDLIWDDVRTGSKTDFGAWKIVPPGAFLSPDRGAFAANTFYGAPTHSKPRVLVPVLSLPFPVKHGTEPEEPTLTSRAEPSRQTNPQVDRIVTVPWTGVYDPDVSRDWQLKNSPFYTVERSVYYRLELFNNNKTSENQLMSQEVQVGITKERSETWEVRTGISVTTEAGVSFKVFSSSISATISVELGFSSTTSVSVMQSRTLRAELLTPSQHSAALWDISYILTVKRADGTPISQTLDFNANGSFLESQYPPPEGAEAAESFERNLLPVDA